MTPSFHAFSNEFLLIKVAEKKPKEQKLEEQKKPDNKAMLAEGFRQSLKWGAGLGLGTGAGWLAGQKLLPKAFPQMSPMAHKLIGAGMGLGTAAAAWGTAAAYAEAHKKENIAAYGSIEAYEASRKKNDAAKRNR